MNDSTTIIDSPIVVIGTGLAGYNLVKEYRKLDKETPILMITADDGVSYSKPMLSTGYTKSKTADQLSMGDVAKMSDQLNVSIRTQTHVTAIDTQSKRIFIGEEPIAYGKLVLAWGASPLKPRIQGDGCDVVYSINNLVQYREFRKACEGKKRVVILGAGLIGCEFANDLTNGGFEVEVVAPGESVLPKLLPSEAGKAVQDGLESIGVKFHLGPLATQIQHEGEGVDIQLSNGHHIKADIVVSATGLQPNIDLAVKTGLEVHHGIVVNSNLRTSSPDVYALGDCAEINGYVLLYVLPLMASARALAKTLTGTETAVNFPAMPVTVKTPACPVVVCPPPKNVQGEWQAEIQDGQNVKMLFKDSDGKAQGFVLTGEDLVKEKGALAKEMPALF